MSLQEKTDNQ